ncbi:transporter substrate-binding domain-containing protein [Elioraea sp.]|uniref:transporter substrate-binding domain-containing protein n=1 Tax=Elioraea sp. TaxID=2185103 RepID=UPI00307D000F
MIARLGGALLAAVLAIGAADPAAAQQRQVRIATEGAYAPWNFTGPGGQLEGFEIDLANDLCRRMNARCTIVAQDWDGIIPGLTAGRYDAIMAGMNITDRRLEVINFSRPYAAGPHAFAVMPNSPLRAMPGTGQTFSLATQEAELVAILHQIKPLLRGRTIGVQTATTNSAFLTQYFGDAGATIREYRTTEEHDLDIASGRLDAIFAAVTAITATAEKPEFRGLAPAGPLMSGGILGRGVAVGLRKADTDLKAAFDAAIEAALKDGTISRLSEKWFKTDIAPRS